MVALPLCPGRRRPAAVGVTAAFVAITIAAAQGDTIAAALLLAVLTVVLAEPAPMFTALAGLAATAYLVLRHGPASATAPTMFAAVGFAVLGTVGAVLPVQIPWLPLAAPLALLAGYLLALRPYLRGGRQPVR